MAGYNWFYGKSNNAVAAEEDGMRVKSKITKDWLREGGVNESAAFVKWLIKVDEIYADEWHHSSKYFNEVDYFAAESIREQLEQMDERGSLAEYRAAYKDPAVRKLDKIGIWRHMRAERDKARKENEALAA